MRVVALYRVSTERQAEEGASLDAQQRKYRELATAQKWTTVGEFRGCESATQAATERHVLQQVLSCIREKEPDAVYVHEQSRLTRGDELEVALLFRELRERGIKVIVGGIVRDLSSIDERFMVGIQSLIDRAESDRLKERSRRGKRERARQGKKNSARAPYGYRNPLPGDPKRGILQIVPEQVAVVRSIFELAAKHMGDRAIARRLNADGVPSPWGSHWDKSAIKRMLCNPVYIGTHVTNAWVQLSPGKQKLVFRLDNPDAIIVPNSHEAIISRELWEAAQHRPPRPQTGRPHLLTGLLHVNGERYSGGWTRDVQYYVNRGKRSEAWLRVEDTDRRVWGAFVSLAADPEYVSALIAEAQVAAPKEQLEAELERHKRQVQKLQHRLDRLIDLRADGDISTDTYRRKVAETQMAIAESESAMQDIRHRMMASDGSAAMRIVSAIRTLLRSSSSLTTQEKRVILGSVARRIDLSVHHSQRRQPRHHGRFQPGGVPKHDIGAVSFTLAVAPDRAGQLEQSSSSPTRSRSRSTKAIAFT